ncbi:hypothetical protein [Zhenhengia sp.]
MTVKELDKIAKKGLEMPKGLASYEQSYYIASEDYICNMQKVR